MKAIDMHQLTYAQITDCGKVRENNEDSMALCIPPDVKDQQIKGALFIVADGLGGLADGEIASRTAVDTLEKLWSDLTQFPGPAWLEEAFQAVNSTVYKVNQTREPYEIMATTLTASLFFKDKLYIGHVGDCRAYRIRDNKIHQLTQDHAIGRHTLTRTIGTDMPVQADVYETPLKKGDIYIQCSDGLYPLLKEKELQEIASQNLPKKGCQEFVKLANQYGGPDNITVQVIHVQ